MIKLVNEMFEKKVWAVVGATINKNKFGYKIYKKLLENGYEVYPINPIYDEIDGEKCYNSLENLPKKPDCINVVVSPERAVACINSASELGVDYMWFQPGTYNDTTISLAKFKKLKIVYNHCVLVELDSIKY